MFRFKKKQFFSKYGVLDYLNSRQSDLIFNFQFNLHCYLLITKAFEYTQNSWAIYKSVMTIWMI